MARNIYEKIWDAHVVAEPEGQDTILYIDRHYVHEVTSPQAFEGLRLNERLRVDWQIDPQALQTKIPSLIIQPLVENAVYHGIEPCVGGGEIRPDRPDDRRRALGPGGALLQDQSRCVKRTLRFFPVESIE